MEAKVIEGYYGSDDTECEIFVYGNYYCVSGSVSVFEALYDDVLVDGIDVETVCDFGMFTWNKPITNLEMLIEAVED